MLCVDDSGRCWFKLHETVLKPSRRALRPQVRIPAPLQDRYFIVKMLVRQMDCSGHAVPDIMLKIHVDGEALLEKLLRREDVEKLSEESKLNIILKTCIGDVDVEKVLRDVVVGQVDGNVKVVCVRKRQSYICIDADSDIIYEITLQH